MAEVPAACSGVLVVLVVPIMGEPPVLTITPTPFTTFVSVCALPLVLVMLLVKGVHEEGAAAGTCTT